MKNKASLSPLKKINPSDKINIIVIRDNNNLFFLG